MWQDFVFLGGSIVIMLSLVPTLRDDDATVPLRTSVPSVVVLFAQTIAFATIGLTASALGTGMGFVLWSLIAKYKGPSGAMGLQSSTDLRQTVSNLVAK